MRFITYNIRLGIQEGVEAIADALRPEQPDVLAIQEVGLDWVMGPDGDTTAKLAELLGLPHHRFARCIEMEGGFYGHALLSRFPIRQAQQFELPIEVDEPRCLLVCELATPLGRITIVSTHLSWIEDRAIQGPIVHQTATRFGAPVVVMGDLNGEDHEPFVKALHEDFADADRAAGRKTFPSHAPRERIDYLLVRGGAWEDVVVGENETASDHRWVAATLNLTSSSS